jgi:hypothetical protein
MRVLTLGEVKEMIEDLVRLHGEDVLEMDAYGVSDYGDHCHTQQLIPLDEPQIVQPRKTAYSESGLALPTEYTEEDTGQSLVVVFGE